MTQVPAAWAPALLVHPNRPVFGVAGSSNFALLSAYAARGGRYVACQHEAGAVAMASGWASACGQPGIASVHQGPGLANAATAIADAVRSGAPVVVIAGHTGDTGSRQHLSSIALVDSLGAVAHVPADDDPAALSAAIAASENAGCTIVVLPPGSGETEPLPPARAAAAPNPAAISALVREVDAASTIALLVGRGAVRSGAVPAIAALAEHLDAALVTTAPAQGAFAGNPRCLGLMGGFATAGTTRALQEADLVIAFGASLDSWTTAGGRILGPRTRVVRVDITPASSSVVADAGQTARALTAAVAARPPGTWVVDSAVRARAPRDFTPVPGLDPRLLLSRLDSLLPAARTLCLDSGHFLALATMMMTTLDGPHVNFGQDAQSVGLGLAHAIGAAMACPERLTVCVMGDGGAAMSMLELATAVDAGLSLLVVIVNDAAYGAEVHDFEPLGLDVSIARFPVRDWAAVARALGAQAVTVKGLDDVEVVQSWLARPEGPLVLDCRVDPTVDAVSIMTAEGQAEWTPHPST